jgi:prevent-host-death family protein
MTRVGIGELRDRVSRYVRRAEKGETIVIVNRDREVAVLQPWRGRVRRRGGLLGAMKGTANVVGDIEAPTHDEKEWFRT